MGKVLSWLIASHDSLNNPCFSHCKTNQSSDLWTNPWTAKNVESQKRGGNSDGCFFPGIGITDFSASCYYNLMENVKFAHVVFSSDKQENGQKAGYPEPFLTQSSFISSFLPVFSSLATIDNFRYQFWTKLFSLQSQAWKISIRSHRKWITNHEKPKMI